MTTKRIAIERNLLDIGDIETSLSARFKRPVSVGEAKCTLAHCVPLDTETPSGAYLIFRVGKSEFDSFDLFWDKENEGHYLNGKRLSFDEPWLPKEEIFSFDVSAFKDFDEWTDSSD